jgi:hypothetical protein
MTFLRIVIPMAAALSLGACGGMNNQTRNVAGGTAGGAALGGLIGSYSGDAAFGALVGAGLGAGAGLLLNESRQQDSHRGGPPRRRGW